MRFLALEGLSAMACTEISHDAVQAHQSTVTKLLHVSLHAYLLENIINSQNIRRRKTRQSSVALSMCCMRFAIKEM